MAWHSQPPPVATPSDPGGTGTPDPGPVTVGDGKVDKTDPYASQATISGLTAQLLGRATGAVQAKTGLEQAQMIAGQQRGQQQMAAAKPNVNQM